MERWYALHTKPKAEYQVAAALLHRGVPTFLPETGPERKKKPFFPSYVFGKIDLEAVGISQLQWMPGLRRIVSFGELPVSLPDEVVDLIRCKMAELEATGGWPAASFNAGDPVRITEGPFQNMVAIFDGPTTQRERVRVLLYILGHASRLQIGINELEKTATRAETPALQRPRRTRGKGRRINYR